MLAIAWAVCVLKTDTYREFEFPPKLGLFLGVSHGIPDISNLKGADF